MAIQSETAQVRNHPVLTSTNRHHTVETQIVSSRTTHLIEWNMSPIWNTWMVQIEILCRKGNHVQHIPIAMPRGPVNAPGRTGGRCKYSNRCQKQRHHQKKTASKYFRNILMSTVVASRWNSAKEIAKSQAVHTVLPSACVMMRLHSAFPIKSNSD